MEEVGSWRLGWTGRVIRAVLKDRLEGEKWDVEVWRGGVMKWEVKIGRNKNEGKKEWEKRRNRYMEEGLVGVSDASKMMGRVGVGGMLWVYRNRYRSWRLGKGYGLSLMHQQEFHFAPGAPGASDASGTPGANRCSGCVCNLLLSIARFPEGDPAIL